jgi:hypothetical protein
LQFQSAKQLRVRSDDSGREAHGDGADTHGQIESPANKNACGMKRPQELSEK